MHTTSQRGKTSMSFILGQFFTEIYFFFKLSSARQEDYWSLNCLTGTLGKFVIKHVETGWLSMKQVAVRVVEQYDNLTEYFLKFLPSKDMPSKNQETCEVSDNNWSTWGFINFSVCVILCFYSLRFWNASVIILIRQAYDTSLISRNAIIATKFHDEIY